MLDQLFFAIKLEDAGPFDAVVRELAACVLERAGYAAPAAADILGGVRAALEQARAEGVRECDAQFRVEAGQLIIVVSYPGGREWRLARPLPAAD